METHSDKHNDQNPEPLPLETQLHFGEESSSTAAHQQPQNDATPSEHHTTPLPLGLRLKKLAYIVFLRYFDLRHEVYSQEEDTIESIKESIEFRGANLWVLIFAIFIASLGLNVNSTAVIIGAMLISPLMGPIIGIGLAVGISDFTLLKRSFKSYALATIISIITATIYFFITPLSDAQSELLARTSPNIYDVLIALFGGFAGIVALAKGGRGNVIPGVAIATALMPPLCTVGFGLGTGNLLFALGALYLFFINTVFIALATLIGVRVMGYKRINIVDAKRRKQVNNYIMGIALATAIPSVYMTYNIVRESLFENNVRQFIQAETHWDGTQVISQTSNYSKKEMRLVLVGKTLSDSTINSLRGRKAYYNLGDVTLHVIQGDTNNDLLLKVMAKQAQQGSKADQAALVADLQRRVTRQEGLQNMGKEVLREMRSLFPTVSSLGFAELQQAHTNDSIKPRIVTIALLRTTSPLSSTDRVQMQRWLTTRTNSDSLRVILE
ncbi:MAG: TIGR00341 family protein [Bacteroidales bacterium]|nr:TIGR00341 family protein [Bacteroidales bacterium]